MTKVEMVFTFTAIIIMFRIVGNYFKKLTKEMTQETPIVYEHKERIRKYYNEKQA